MPLFLRLPLLTAALLSLSLNLSGCAQKTPQTSSTAPAKALQPTGRQPDAIPPAQAREANIQDKSVDSHALEDSSSCTTPQAVRISEHNRANCYRLQPAKTVLVKHSSGKTGGKGKASKQRAAATKSTLQTAATVKAASKTPAKGSTKSTSLSQPSKKSPKTVAKKGGKQSKPVAAPAPQVERTVGLCQPQSLIYARCRTGMTTCQMGDTSPVEWFTCARQNGATSATPVAGSVIVIDTHKERRIYTGHPAYVEEAQRNADGTWKLRISHTNYDRKCHLDLDAQVLFDPRTMTATFQSGHWAPWAHRLRVLGFILR